MLFQGIFLECPPSSPTFGEVKITEEWLTDEETKALFAASNENLVDQTGVSWNRTASWLRQLDSLDEPRRRNAH
jgi:hypothetical protein